MGGLLLHGALAALLLTAWTADAEARGRRRSFTGGPTHYYDNGPTTGGAPRPATTPVALPPATCTPQAPCSTSNGSRYFTDPTTGVSQFLPR